MDKVEFKEIIDGLRSVYGNRNLEMSGFARELWYECLEDLNFTITKKAIINYAKKSKFAPTASDIRVEYGLIIAEKQKTLNILEEIFYFMRNRYPGGKEDRKASEIFYSKICEKDIDERCDYAEVIKNSVLDYVSRCEQRICEMDMSLSECIKAVCDE